MSIIGSLLRRSTSYLLSNTIKSTKSLKSVDRIQVSIPSMSYQFSSVSDLRVEHNQKKHQFFVRLGSETAVIDYRDVSPGVVDFIHTEVPKELQGKGIAKILAKEAFDYVVKNNLRMIVSCSYLQKYLKDNPKADHLKQLFQTEESIKE